MSGTSAAPPTVWITRTRPWADDSAVLFTKAGYAVRIAPLLSVVPVTPAPKRPPLGSTLIFTSKNGVAHFAAAHKARDFSVITVGDATATAAIDAGFKAVQSARGTSTDILTLIMGMGDFDTGYTHCAGTHVRGQITEALSAAGFTAARQIYYSAKPAHPRPDMAAKPGDIIALYSPKAAQALVDWQAETHRDLSDVTALSISAATNAPLGTLNIGKRIIAARPDERSMLAALKASTNKTR